MHSSCRTRRKPCSYFIHLPSLPLYFPVVFPASSTDTGRTLPRPPCITAKPLLWKLYPKAVLFTRVSFPSEPVPHIFKKAYVCMRKASSYYIGRYSEGCRGFKIMDDIPSPFCYNGRDMQKGEHVLWIYCLLCASELPQDVL